MSWHSRRSIRPIPTLKRRVGDITHRTDYSMGWYSRFDAPNYRLHGGAPGRSYRIRNSILRMADSIHRFGRYVSCVGGAMDRSRDFVHQSQVCRVRGGTPLRLQAAIGKLLPVVCTKVSAFGQKRTRSQAPPSGKAWITGPFFSHTIS